MRTTLAFLSLSAFSIAIASAQVAPTNFVKNYAGSDNLAHVVDVRGADKAIPAEKGQDSVDLLKLSPDGTAAGWEVKRQLGCQSYPVATSLVLYTATKKTVLNFTQIIYDWCFDNTGTKVALSTGPSHGMTTRQLALYDIRTGKLLKQWDGAIDAKPPLWAKDLSQ